MKETILHKLRQGGHISGEEMGNAMGISRTAVWKYVTALRREGYRIDSSPGCGYSLLSAPDSLLPEEIKVGLRTSVLGRRIAYHREVASTQEVAKALAAQGASEGTAVIAETQRGGRGRIGRTWASPPGGIYLSIILRPNIKPSESLRFPLIAGVAVAQAIERLTGLSPKLKWPNDIIVAGRKAGGILLEMSAEMDRTDYIIIGMGINVNTRKAHFPEEIAGMATSLREECGKQIPRVNLLQEILAQLESLYQDSQASGFEPIRERWKSLSNTIGARVRISSGGTQVEGEAIDIDGDGALILRKANGALEKVIAGDVSGGRSQESGARNQESGEPMNYHDMAERSLHGLSLEREECYSILHCPEVRMLELLESAFSVRERYFGRKVVVHLLVNAKSGLCLEDCAYCSQSATSQASIERYPLLDEGKILEAARVARANQAKRYCIVTSGRSPSQAELDHLCRVIRKIKETVDIEICTSLGFLTEQAAKQLREAGVDSYNHNLNTSQRFYPQICTTHSYADRIETLRHARKANLALCCGSLFGMGESEEDIIDLAFALRELGADSIPINFLHPIPGTPLKTTNYLTPLKCLAILSLIRLLNPRTEIRVAGGREYHLRSLQPLALYAANSIFVSGYLTTDGQAPAQDLQMIRDMGFEVDMGRVSKVEATL